MINQNRLLFFERVPKQRSKRNHRQAQALLLFGVLFSLVDLVKSKSTKKETPWPPHGLDRISHSNKQAMKSASKGWGRFAAKVTRRPHGL